MDEPDENAPTTQTRSGGARTALLVLVLLVSSCILLLVLGALRDPARSAHGLIGSAVWTTFGPHFVLLSLLGVMASAAVCLGRAPRLALASLGVTGLALAGGSAICAGMVAATAAAGGTANPLTGLWLSSMSGGGPDQQLAHTVTRDQELKVAVYRPAAGDGRHPTLLYIHCGGFKVGSFVETDADLRWFAEQGWLVFSVEYRLWTPERPTWELASKDIACAAAWLRDNAAGLGADLDRWAVLGDSAGGNLAINYAYAAAARGEGARCRGEPPVPQAVVVQYPAVDPLAIYEHGYPVRGFEPRMLIEGYLGGDPYAHPDRVAAVSSYGFVSGAAPRTLVIAPEKDGLVPSWSVYHFTDYARLAGVEVELVRIPHASHVYNQIAANSIGNQARRSITRRYLEQQGLGAR